MYSSTEIKGLTSVMIECIKAVVLEVMTPSISEVVDSSLSWLEYGGLSSRRNPRVCHQKWSTKMVTKSKMSLKLQIG